MKMLLCLSFILLSLNSFAVCESKETIAKVKSFLNSLPSYIEGDEVSKVHLRNGKVRTTSKKSWHMYEKESEVSWTMNGEAVSQRGGGTEVEIMYQEFIVKDGCLMIGDSIKTQIKKADSERLVYSYNWLEGNKKFVIESSMLNKTDGEFIETNKEWEDGRLIHSNSFKGK